MLIQFIFLIAKPEQHNLFCSTAQCAMTSRNNKKRKIDAMSADDSDGTTEPQTKKQKPNLTLLTVRISTESLFRHYSLYF